MRYFSSESVTEGHPDKVSDIIADRARCHFNQRSKSESRS